MTERVEQARASILHQRPYRETSLLLEVFTRDHGRIGLVANGARRPKSRLRALLQPMQELSLSWHLKGDLGGLRGAESLSLPLRLQGDALYAGFYMNELLLRLCVRGDPHPDLYDCYRSALLALAQTDEPGIVLRLFERDLLEAIGYGLQLGIEAETGQPIQAQSTYSFDVQSGAKQLSGSAADTGFSGAALLALQSGDLQNPQHRAQAKRILQSALNRLLDNKPLRTVQTLRQMRSGATQQGTA